MGRIYAAADVEEVVEPTAPRIHRADEVEEVAEQAPEGPSTLTALARGAGQGASLNFGDEIVGLGKALFSKETLEPGGGNFAQRYRQGRDENRAANAAAQQAHPFAYGAGELGGGVVTSFVPGLGIAKGASLAKTALGAAKMGAAAGLGGSESEDLGGQLLDAGTSALASGGTTGLLGKAIRGAPERVVKRALGDITDGATATMRDRVVGKAVKGEGPKNIPEVMSVLGDKAFKKAGRDPNKLLQATEEALEETGARLDEAYAAAGVKTPGIRVKDIQKALNGVAKELEADPGKLSLARAVRAQMDDVWEAWGTKDVASAQTNAVSAQAVRELAKDIGDAAFRGSPAIAPKAGQKVAQRVWGEMKDLIDKNLDEAGVGSKQVQALNKRMSTLMNMREAVRYRATREGTESTRLKDRISGGLDMGLALADPTTFVVKKTYDFVGKPLMRAGDERLAQLVTAARNGSKAAQIKERALMLGFSPVVAGSLSTWAQRTAQEMTGGGYEATAP